MFPRKNCFTVGPAKRRTSETEAFKLKKHKYTVSKAGCNLTGAGTSSCRGGRRPAAGSSASATESSQAANAGVSAEQADTQEPSTDEQQHDEAGQADQHASVDHTADATAAGCSFVLSRDRPATCSADIGSKATRYEATERNWDSFDVAAPDVLFGQLPSMQRVWQLTHSAMQQHLQQAACHGECERCGCSTAECVVLRQVTVKVIDLHTCCSLNVNVYECCR